MSSTFLQFLKISNRNPVFKESDCKTSRMQVHPGRTNYRYLAVETFTPGPMVEATVQERIY